jgi:hypothetical protein
MRYFRLYLLGNTDDRSIAFVRDAPAGLGLYDACMRRGERIGARFPRNARVYVHSGRKLGSVLGNTLSYLMVTAAVKDVIVATCKCEIEALPFALYDRKRHLLSRDYWILNPLGTFDCVNRKESDIRYFDATKKDIVGVRSLVFDGRRMAKAPDLFRVPEEPAALFASEALATALKPLRPTNIIFTEDMKLKPAMR